MSGEAPLVLSLSKDRLTMSGEAPLVLSLSKDRLTMSGLPQVLRGDNRSDR
jgi:hypothetical protein